MQMAMQETSGKRKETLVDWEKEKMITKGKKE